MSAKPFLTARQAADLIGCTPEVVIADVRRGYTGELDALIGGDIEGAQWFVPVWEFEGPRLEMHRRRLCAADREGLAND